MPLNSKQTLSSSMELDTANAPTVMGYGKQHAEQEEKEADTHTSTSVDIRSGDDDRKERSGEEGEFSTDGMTPTQQLLYAAEKGDCNLIRAAIARGVDVKVHDMGPKAQAEEKRAMELAAGKKKSKKQLAAEQKEQETMFRDIPVTEDTALHKAAEKGHTAAVDLLFYSEADVEAKNRLGSTALHRAVSAKQPEVAAQLLRHGARHDAVNAIGNTALHIASYQGDLEMAQLLIAHAKHEAYRAVVAVNQAGVTPIDYARKKQMHALLTSYRLLSSATSSFIRHPPGGEHPADGTPKHGRMLIAHVSGGADSAPQLARPGSWAKPGGAEEGRQVSGGHKEEHGRAGEQLHPVHHHAPNPPISGHHSATRGSHSGEQHSAPSHQTPTGAARPLHSAEPADSHLYNSTVQLTSASDVDSDANPTTAAPPASAPPFAASASHSASSAGHSLQTPKQLHPSVGEGPALHAKPSFEKTSSLDSHPLDSARHTSLSTVGQIVSPVSVGRGVEGSGSVSVAEGAGGARGVSMAALSLNMLPNEVEPREEKIE